MSHIQGSEFAHLGPGVYSIRKEGGEAKICRESSCFYTQSNFDLASAIRKLAISAQKFYSLGPTDKPVLKSKEVLFFVPHL